MSSSTPSSKVNIIIIGGGLIGPRHALSIISNPSTHLLALIDPAPHGPETASSLSTHHFPSIASLLSSCLPKPDAAIICTPNKTHVPIALELIAAGIHILVEKPISTSIPEGLALIAAAREKGVKVLAGHHRRFNPYLLAAKKALDESSLGQVVAVQGTWCLRKPAAYYDGIGEWRKSGESGGVVLINLVHEVDLLQYLLGPITIVSAVETVRTRGFDAEEGAAIILRFESGVVGTFLLSDSTPSPWNFEGGTGENPMIPQVRDEDAAGGFYRIMGTNGSLSVPDLMRWTGEWNEKPGKEGLEVQKEIVPFDKQIEHFARVVRGSERPRCTAEEALSAMVVCEAVKEAMRSGLWVEINEFEVNVRGASLIESRT
ncbi:NAD(P)-binding protein [Cadophora sp. DSE1049]|nr:NAD(P)-binding protein [Cadophora sp. DSE1049]